MNRLSLIAVALFVSASAFVVLSDVDSSVADPDYSGYCGDDAKYVFEPATGTLTISGSGSMDNYSYSSTPPWYSFRDKIVSVDITGSVSSIGSYAFKDCTALSSVTIGDSVTTIEGGAFYSTALSSVTIPKSVTYIGLSAFSHCASLTSVILPDSITSLSASTFDSCTSLTSVAIPNTVTFIGDYVFDNCSSLTAVTIPASVTDIGYYVFRGCTALTAINVDEKNTEYSSENGVLFDQAKTKLILYPAGKTDAAYTIPDSVTFVGFCAFQNCSSLTSVTIGKQVQTIGSYAFQNCTSLTSVTIDNSVEDIGIDAFSGCSSVKAVVIGDSVKNIDYRAFFGCTSLTSVTIGDSVSIIRGDAFGECTALTYVTIPKSATYITGDPFDGKFYDTDCTTELVQNATNLAGFTFKKTGDDWYKQITGNCGDNATYEFDPATGTLTISGSGKMSDFTEISVPWNTYKDSIKTVVITGSVESVGSNAFLGCTAISSVSLSGSITSIGSYAFQGCISLVSVTISDSVTTIGSHAFSNCTSLASITFPDSVTSIGDSAFDGKFYNADGKTELEQTAKNLAGSTFKKIDGKWIKQNTVPSDDGSDKGSNTLIYLIVGVVAILAVLGAVAYVMKRRD